MIVDASALIAILRREPGAQDILDRALAADCRMSAATFVEVSIVADRRAGRRVDQVDRLIDVLGIQIVPVTERQALLARTAYRRYGKGSGSKAQLNFGDCFSYALAVDLGEELLYVGDDFTHTDVVSF